MKTLMGTKESPFHGRRSVVTIGNFDGVHLGHRKIISRLKALSAELGASSVVVTFDPHPRQVLFPEQGLKRLFPHEDLVEQLTDLQLDFLVVEPFSRALSQLSPDRFFNDHILRPFAPVAMVVGYDFSFGADRKGTLETLQHLTDANGVRLEVIPPFKLGDIVVSSSRIRQAVGAGDVALAREMLDRPYSLTGIVERGAGRGRQLGVPTANIHTAAEILPALGVYATYVTWKGARLKSVTNIGVNPTFLQGENLPVKIEAHVLDLNSDLYGETLKLEFVQRLRGEMKFPSIDQLKNQIAADIASAREILK